MLVGERMKSPVVTVSPDTPIVEASHLMKREHIRRIPVVEDGKIVGIVSKVDLLNASPSPVTSLSIWEINELVSRVLVKEVMAKNVLTVTEGTPIEEAARIMADNQIGGLPVLRGDAVVGIITETDLFKLFIELMGAREPGIRVMVLVAEKPGQLARITKAIADHGGNFVAFSQFAGVDASNRLITCKVAGLNQNQVSEILTPLVEKIVDLRTV